jgi:hypothetical protein
MSSPQTREVMMTAQKVTAGGLAYLVDFPVNVGDWLELPDTGFIGSTWRGKVTALSADYDGPCKRALRNLGNDKERQERRVRALENEERRVGHDLEEARERLAVLEGETR